MAETNLYLLLNKLNLSVAEDELLFTEGKSKSKICKSEIQHFCNAFVMWPEQVEGNELKDYIQYGNCFGVSFVNAIKLCSSIIMKLKRSKLIGTCMTSS